MIDNSEEIDSLREFRRERKEAIVEYEAIL